MKHVISEKLLGSFPHRAFSYSNYIFNIPTSCTLYNWIYIRITKSLLHISVQEVLLEDGAVCTETGKRGVVINIRIQLQNMYLIVILKIEFLWIFMYKYINCSWNMKIIVYFITSRMDFPGRNAYEGYSAVRILIRSRHSSAVRQRHCVTDHFHATRSVQHGGPRSSHHTELTHTPFRQ